MVITVLQPPALYYISCPQYLHSTYMVQTFHLIVLKGSIVLDL